MFFCLTHGYDVTVVLKPCFYCTFY